MANLVLLIPRTLPTLGVNSAKMTIFDTLWKFLTICLMFFVDFIIISFMNDPYIDFVQIKKFYNVKIPCHSYAIRRGIFQKKVKILTLI